jgi:AraC-like DNA-binding protein
LSYTELPPPPQLAATVACTWWRGPGPVGSVLPDGCVDIVWTGTKLVVAGPATRAVTPDVPAAGPKLGIRFRVGAAGPALGLPAAELLDDSPPLAALWSRGHEYEQRLGEASGLGERLGLLVEATAALRPASESAPDPLVRAAALAIRRRATRIAALGGELGISERQLRRRFADAVGLSPRTLGRVLRLQRFLALASAGGHDLARSAAEAGYADQPHLTRDCKELAGLPPAALLATRAGPAGEPLT